MRVGWSMVRSPSSKRVLGGWPAPGGGGGGGLCVAEGGSDPGNELGGGERFDDVVDGAHLEGFGDEVVLAVGGQEDDRDVAGGEDVAHDLDAVGVRKHQIQQHHMGVGVREHGADFGGVAGHGRRVAGGGEGVADVFEVSGVVVDGQHPRRAGRRGWGCAAAGGGGGGLVGCGEREREPAAQSGSVALGPDAPAVGLGDAFADG